MNMNSLSYSTSRVTRVSGCVPGLLGASHVPTGSGFPATLTTHSPILPHCPLVHRQSRSPARSRSAICKHCNSNLLLVQYFLRNFRNEFVTIKILGQLMCTLFLKRLRYCRNGIAIHLLNWILKSKQQ